MMVDLSTLRFASATEVAKAIRSKSISSFELTQFLLDRIEKYNSTLNAFTVVLKDEALRQAKQADAALAQGTIWGPLHGVPVTIKDVFEIQGVLTTGGLAELATHIPEKDAIVTERLKSAGAIILGHTNVMGKDWQCYNDLFGTTNNPWDLSRTPGGSTGGGAAALAAGLTYLSVASDVGGSIRIPSHFCGVFGHKSSQFIVPYEGNILPANRDLWVAGPLARTAEDLKLALEVLGGPARDEAKAFSWLLPPPRKTKLADYRIGYVVDDPVCPVSGDVKDVLLLAIDTLRQAGSVIREGWPSGVNARKQYETYLFLLYSDSADEIPDDQIASYRKLAQKQDGTHKAIMARSWSAPHKAYMKAAHDKQIARKVWQEFFSTYDAFFMPPSLVPAYPHDHSQPRSERTLKTSYGSWAYMDMFFWISFATLTGLPATVAPIGVTQEGLPVGIQIIGPYLEDATPIHIAQLLTKQIGGFHPPQGY